MLTLETCNDNKRWFCSNYCSRLYKTLWTNWLKRRGKIKSRQKQKKQRKKKPQTTSELQEISIVMQENQTRTKNSDVWAMFSLNRDKEFLQASCRSAWLIPEASTKAVFLKPLVCLVYADCFLRRRCVMQQVMALVWNGCNSKPIRIMVVNGCTLT